MEQLDPDAVNLTKAIRQTESGGNFTAKGKSGEYGAYQFTQPTWDAYAKKYGVNTPLQQATPEQQNEVAYKQIKEWKDKGHNVGQIASMWNAGEGKPDAYLENNVGTNKYGVHYDTPAYAKSVATAYQTIKAGGDVQADPNNPSSTANQTPQQTPQNQTSASSNQDDWLNNPLTRGIQDVFPGQQVGQAIGTLGGLAYEKAKGLLGGQDNSATYDVSAPTPLQVGGDIAQGALTVGAGMPEAGALSAFGKTLPAVAKASSAIGRIGQLGAVGAGVGASGALAQGQTDPSEIAKQAAIGAGTAGTLGAAGEIVSKAAQSLPSRIVNNFIPKLNEGTTQYALDKGLGSPKVMLADSNTSINKLGNQLGSALGSDQYKGISVTGQDIYQKFMQEHPDAGVLPDQFFAEIKKLAGLKAGLVDSLATPEGLSIKQLQSLNSAIGKNTFKSVFDNPEVKTGKQIGSTAYHAISDAITSIAPETKPLYQDLTKEYQLNTGLTRAVNQGRKAGILSLRDIVGMMGGFSAGGFVPGMMGYAAMRATESPTLNLKAAGMLNKLAKPSAAKATRGLLPTLIRGANQAQGTPNQ